MKNQSASRHTNKKVRKKDIKIKSENQNIRKRSKKRLKSSKKKIYDKKNFPSSYLSFYYISFS